MNTLKLTKEQENKLIVLCQNFFPECVGVAATRKINENGKNVAMKPISRDLEIVNDTVKFPYVDWGDVAQYVGTYNIHWHELCFTHLPNRIWDRLTFEFRENVYCDTHLDFLCELISSGKHPVDFLFEYVKEHTKAKNLLKEPPKLKAKVKLQF